MRSPVVVLVSGQPASGKTTLARLLAGQLGLPIVSRDAITEALADTLGRPSHELVEPSFALFWRLLKEQVDGSAGAVGETNLHRGVSERAVERLAAHADVRLVFCMTSRELSVARFVERFERGERHWCFDDARRVERLRTGEPDPAWDNARPLNLHLPTLIVDTSDGYKPGLAAIVGTRVAAGSRAGRCEAGTSSYSKESTRLSNREASRRYGAVAGKRRNR